MAGSDDLARRVEREHCHAERARAGLLRLINSCLTSGSPPEVNLQVPRHYVTGPVLREVAFEPRYAGKSLPVVFTDGSRPPPFPAGVLAGRVTPKRESKEDLLRRAGSVLKVGVMSMRHPELDYVVDLYVTRNTELARDEDAAADRERLSHARTVTVLSDPVLDGGGEVWAYHTGFEPMIVGFYRGVAEVLARRRAARKAPLVIRPWLFNTALRAGEGSFAADDERPDEEDAAHPEYTPDSPGAKPQDYDPLPPWY